jgi:hypothetical protein
MPKAQMCLLTRLFCRFWCLHFSSCLVYSDAFNPITKASTDVGLNNMGRESETYLQPLSHESLSNHGGAALSVLDFIGAENGILRRAFSNKLAVRRSRK